MSENCPGKVRNMMKRRSDFEKRDAAERKKILLYLISDYLRQNRFYDSAQILDSEAKLNSNITTCDNVNLDIILQEYQSYYSMKFNKMPSMIREVRQQPRPFAFSSVHQRQQNLAPPTQAAACSSQIIPPVELDDPSNLEFQFDIRELSISKLSPETQPTLLNVTDIVNGISGLKVRPDKPDFKVLCESKGTEWKEKAEMILKEIVPHDLGTTWKDCLGLDYAITLLKEAVIYPLDYPDLFTGLITPWKGILLYGPPGTGKTLLAKALACESQTTFFNVTTSTFVSKWRGESEKMIKVLFDLARHFAPSTIFVDEFDAFASKQEDMEHDASRRFKGELLIQLDGLLRAEDNVFVLAATNVPWDLNTAILRRFEKRILVNLPTPEARTEMFKHYFSMHQNNFRELDYKRMTELSNNYSGSDLRNVCKECCMSAARDVLANVQANGSVNVQLFCPTIPHFKEAITKIKPVVNKEYLDKYVAWHNSFSSC